MKTPKEIAEIETESFTLIAVDDDPLNRLNIVYLRNNKTGEGTGLDLDELFKEKM